MLSAQHISFSYHKKPVLTDVCFRAGQGDIIGIIGTNGCGKSTLLSILAGVQRPSGGQLTFMDQSLLTARKEMTRTIGYVPQRNPLLPELTVKDNLSLWQLACSEEQASERTSLFSLLGLAEVLKQPVRKLSEGMKKRVSIASALQNHPSILVLDEPTAALDLPCKELIHQALLAFAKNGGIVVITTHEEPDFLLCTKLFILKNGTLSLADSSLSKEQLIQQM